MEIAVVGAGFSGLALCYYLGEAGHSVTLYDREGIGAGASGASSGLLHPYPGRAGRLSWRGHEAYAETMNLLKISQAPYSQGLIRDGMLKEGVTVHPKLYLRGLFAQCKHLRFVQEEISTPPEADCVIFAVGAGVTNLAYDLPIRLIKGQVLKARGEIAHSEIVPGGYMAKTASDGIIHLGSTYEHGFESPDPDLARAKELILPKHPNYKEKDILGCQAGVRVANIHGYRPILEEVAPRVWVMTGMGSRGLLYHALYAKDFVSMFSYP